MNNKNGLRRKDAIIKRGTRNRNKLPPENNDNSNPRSILKNLPVIFEAIYDYDRRGQGDISLVKGEYYMAYYDPQTNIWLWAENLENGEIGWIPLNCLKPLEKEKSDRIARIVKFLKLNIFYIYFIKNFLENKIKLPHSKEILVLLLSGQK